MLTRRQLMLGLTSVGASACVPDKMALENVISPDRTPSSPSLKVLGARRGLEIGSAFNGNGDPKYRRLLAKHCGLIVPEWQLKPRFLRPNHSSSYRFGPCDKIAAFAASNRMDFHGHTLFWHEEPIRWVESNDFAEVKRGYGGFIRDVVAHYPRAVSWDVFNEIIGDRHKYRNEFLIRKFGPKFIDFALRTTHEVAPRARLSINEYNLECGASWCRSKQDSMLALLKELKRQKTPIHAVGIQGHLSSIHPASPSATLSFIDRVADLGLDVYISELDVNDSTMPKDIATRDRMVADYYEEFLTAVLRRPAVKRLVFWGISDFDNWIVRRYTQEKRPLGAGDARPALFDSNNEPKPAFDAVVRALGGTSSRTA
ncbi:endo-1,4-beta-xylanase [Chelativorans salis]|uniref:Beta-xylanase n=1 Tax=Chelativorans salis TaxID=2978478 RepID=A0ABT2LIJ9_9HYPH|nr:endo-1,4-beta-xylanase [Chelativorans sp. EGI FJ00035]MCT7374056.1 endo-1,4-beta-xylanase [Chelativorans sp. EGI FJ00035]